MSKILVVDDEASVLQSMEILLKSEGHEVVTMRDSEKAAEMIKNERYDLLITDIRMSPVDGMQLIKLAHSKTPPIPTIVVSAYGSENTEHQSFDLGCTAYIQKPFKIQHVLDAVRKVFLNK
ncbi:MAG: response regulator [Kiritimatiellae bacterium]|nr:response regulator [Kiritimatiellia bacterium]MDD5521402.1 response regulator [Kiritimatiellia bacterium]